MPSYYSSSRHCLLSITSHVLAVLVCFEIPFKRDLTWHDRIDSQLCLPCKCKHNSILTKASVSVKDWRMSPHGVVGPRTKVDEIRGIIVNILIKPLTMPNFIALGQTVYEKSVTKFLHPSLFWRSRGIPWAKVHQSRWWYIARPLYLAVKCYHLLTTCLQDIYLLPRFVDFADGVIDRQTRHRATATRSIRWHFAFGD